MKNTDQWEVFQDTKVDAMDYSETHFRMNEKKKHNIFSSELKNLTWNLHKRIYVYE